MFTLAHLTDPHLGPLPEVRARDLASKRVFGYVNWHRNRAHAFDDRILDMLTEDIRAHQPDHIAVTGDLVNLGLHEEFVAAHDWLKRLGEPAHVSVIPGNHDAYVPAAIPQVAEAWRQFMANDDVPHGAARFPFVRRRGPVAIIGLSSAVATAPLMATGHIGADQAAQLGDYLAALAVEERFRVVLIHHPPTARSAGWNKRLIGAGRFRAEVARHGAELVLHGHNHRTQITRIAGAGSPVPVVGAAAASSTPRYGRAGGSYNLYRIGGRAGQFTCTMIERGVRQIGGKIETLSEAVLMGQ